MPLPRAFRRIHKGPRCVKRERETETETERQTDRQTDSEEILLFTDFFVHDVKSSVVSQ